MIDDTIANYFPINKNFLLWVTHKTTDGQLWYVVSDLFRNEYYLFKGKRQLKHKSENPLDLYKYIKEK